MSRSKRRTPAHARAAARAAHPGLTPRNVVLAGIGAVAAGRRRARAAFDAVAIGAATLPARGRATARAAAQQAVALANEAEAKFAPLRREAKARLAPLRRRAEALVRDAEREFEAVATPVLAKLGIAPARKRRASPAVKSAGRKPSARKSGARRAAGQRAARARGA